MALKDQYFTISEAAREMRVTRQTVSRWISERKISAEKVGRETLIEKNELERFMLGQKVMETAEKIVNDIIIRIRKRYHYTGEDTITFVEFDQRKTYLFSIERKDGTLEMVSVDIGKVESLNSRFMSYILVGFKVPIEKIERQKYIEEEKE